MSNHPACRSLRRCLLAGLMVLLLVALTAPASGQSRSYIPDLDIVLVIDESGSLWELNDPPDSNTGNPGWRIVMANMFGDLLGVDQSGAQHRLAIVTFGTEAKLAQPLTAIQNQRSRDEIKQSLAKAHTNMGWTAIPKALDVALDELEARGRTGANAKQAIVFLSDGRCELHESMTKAETALCNQEARLLMERAQAAHCPIYTIAFTSAAFKSDAGNEIYKNLWQEIANTTQGLYFEPERPETGLLDAYTNIIRHLFGLSGQDVPPPVEAPIELTYEARPNLLQVIFTIIKYNKDITTTIIRPDGSVVRSGDPGVEISSSAQTDSYSIMRPPAGRWTVRLSGSGKVTFVDIPIPITARVEPLAPGATHPLGKPMDIVARVVDAEMVPQQLSDLTLVIKAPGGATVAVPIARDGEFYRARLEDTSARGTYVLTYNGEHKGAPVEYEQSVNVVAAPWLKLTEPAPGKSYPFDQVPVKAQLMLGTQPSPADPQDRLECVAQVVPEGGRAWEAPLVAGRDGLFSGVVKGERPGTYPLRVQLTLTRPTGERFQDVTEATVTLQGAAAPAPLPTAPPTTTLAAPTRTPAPTQGSGGPGAGAIAGVLGGLLALAAAGGAGWWWFNLPALSGTLEMGGDWIPLSGKRPITIGSDPRCQVHALGADVLPRHATLRPIGSRQNPQVEIRAVDATAPLRVNGMETAYEILKDGDTIEIGDQAITCSGLPGGFDDLGDLGGLGTDPFAGGQPPDGGPDFDGFGS